MRHLSFGRRSPFHESYYKHPCTVVTDLDVLDTDIPGNGPSARFLRWWYNLFLLSYGNEESRLFFVSSQVLRLERMRHYRKFRSRIHPLSKFSNAWNNLILAVLVINNVLFNQNTALMYGYMPKYSLLVGFCMEIVLVFDIFINFKTGYTDTKERKVILDSSRCFWHYSKTRLFFHTASAIPLQGTMLLRYGFDKCNLCRANRFVCCLKFISIVGYIRVFDTARFLGKPRDSFLIRECLIFLKIFILGMLTMLQFWNFFDTFNVLTMIHTNQISRFSYFSLLVRMKIAFPNEPFLMVLVAEFSIIIKSLFLSGYGMFKHRYYVDKLFGLLCEIIGISFVTCLLKEVFAVYHRVKFTDDMYIQHRQRSTNWMRSQHISDKVADKVKEYFKFSPSRILLFERQNKLFTLLPNTLKKELKLSAYYDLIRKIPYFIEWPVNVVEEMTLLLKQDIFLKNDLVAQPFVQGEGLVVVTKGVLAVYTIGDIELGHLIDGDYFGELSLVTDKEIRTSSVVAVTNVQVVTLSKRMFRTVMRKHSQLFFELRKILREKFETRDRNTTVN